LKNSSKLTVSDFIERSDGIKIDGFQISGINQNNGCSPVSAS